ncbi:hypothetical protein FACS1894110_08740 [Spirochaetia bacterium]|nr:hypothetical protein FACS1894110_08740 [Spirochaetia bacterium]
MIKKHITLTKKSLQEVDKPLKGTPAELLGLVWPLTAEVAALGGYDVKQRLQRNVVRIVRRSGLKSEG